MSILGTGIDIVETNRLKKLLLKKNLILKIKFSLIMKSHTVKKKQILLTVIRKDLLQKKLLLKHWALVLETISILKISK